jgi:hypothetical protein
MATRLKRKLVVPGVGLKETPAQILAANMQFCQPRPTRSSPRLTRPPIEQRTSALRRLMLLFGAAIIVGTGMTAYELVQLEYGGA